MIISRHFHERGKCAMKKNISHAGAIREPVTYACPYTWWLPFVKYSIWFGAVSGIWIWRYPKDWFRQHRNHECVAYR
jgi:hypothetical protein